MRYIKHPPTSPAASDDKSSDGVDYNHDDVNMGRNPLGEDLHTGGSVE